MCSSPISMKFEILIWKQEQERIYKPPPYKWELWLDEQLKVDHGYAQNRREALKDARYYFEQWKRKIADIKPTIVRIVE
jgi:hypothetical protein